MSGGGGIELISIIGLSSRAKTRTQDLDVGDNLSLEVREDGDKVTLGSCFPEV